MFACEKAEDVIKLITIKVNMEKCFFKIVKVKLTGTLFINGDYSFFSI